MTDMRALHAAAVERRANVRQLLDRPQRRRLDADSTPARGGFTAIPVRTAFTTRAAGDAGAAHFTGLASAYEKPYEMHDGYGPYTEVISRGAGAVSLARPDLDVTLNLGHDQIRRIATTLSGTLALAETDAGLEVDAPNLNPADPDVDYILRKISDGLITEMSFAFRIVRGIWSPDYTEYRIEEYDINRGDVAIVGYGANPATSATARQLRGVDLIPEARTRRLVLI